MHVNSTTMADMYHIPATSSSSSSPPQTTDDISIFLRQILLNSSSIQFDSKQMQCQIPQLQPVYPSGSSVPGRIPTFSGPGGACFQANTASYVSSSSVGTGDNDLDECDCESEEGFENLMEEMAVKSNPPRNPSKRARAAEVHNLSEKRRRSRINEKMKALQKLIPNSNKTDKASMLDEAIEYLKQLQLRVQMLTMRNGINLYSMSIPPGVLQPNQLLHSSRIGLNEENAPVNVTSLHQETHVNPMFDIPVQCTNQNTPSIPDFSHLINPGPSSTHESFRIQHGSFQFSKPSKEYCTEGMLSCPRTDANGGVSNSLESQMGVKSEGAGLMNPILPLDLDGGCTRNVNLGRM